MTILSSLSSIRIDALRNSLENLKDDDMGNYEGLEEAFNEYQGVAPIDEEPVHTIRIREKTEYKPTYTEDEWKLRKYNIETDKYDETPAAQGWGGGPQVPEPGAEYTIDENVNMKPFSLANMDQVGGSHYKSEIQVWDFIIANDIGYLAGNVVKYVSRYKKKGGIEDLEKAQHYLSKLIEVEGGKL